MSDDERPEQTPRRKSISSMIENDTYGAAELGRITGSGLNERPATISLRNSPTSGNFTNQIPASRLMSDPAARKTNEQLAELLAFAKEDAAEQRRLAAEERAHGKRSLTAARIAAAVAVLSLVLQVTFFFVTK